MPIKTNYHFVWSADVLSESAMKRMRELYGEKFPNKNQQIALVDDISKLIDKHYPFLPDLEIKITLNKKTEIPYCYVRIKKEK